MLERRFKEVKRRTRVVGDLPPRDDREHPGDSHRLEERRGVSAEAYLTTDASKKRRNRTHNFRDVDAVKSADPFR